MEEVKGLSPDPTNSTEFVEKKTPYEERRALVYKYYLQNIPQGTIAKILGVHRNTIVNDLKFLRKGGAEKIVGLRRESDEEVADHMESLKYVEGEALQQYELADEDKALKKGYLELMLKAREARIALEFKTGVIPVVDKKISTGTAPVDKESDLVDDITNMNRDDILKMLDQVTEKKKTTKSIAG